MEERLYCPPAVNQQPQVSPSNPAHGARPHQAALAWSWNNNNDLPNKTSEVTACQLHTLTFQRLSCYLATADSHWATLPASPVLQVSVVGRRIRVEPEVVLIFTTSPSKLWVSVTKPKDGTPLTVHTKTSVLFVFRSLCLWAVDWTGLDLRSILMHKLQVCMYYLIIWFRERIRVFFAQKRIDIEQKWAERERDDRTRAYTRGCVSCISVKRPAVWHFSLFLNDAHHNRQCSNHDESLSSTLTLSSTWGEKHKLHSLVH